MVLFYYIFVVLLSYLLKNIDWDSIRYISLSGVYFAKHIFIYPGTKN